MSQLTIDYLATQLELEIMDAHMDDSFVLGCKFAKFQNRVDQEMWITDFRVNNIDNAYKNDPRGHDLKDEGLLYLWLVKKINNKKYVWNIYLSSSLEIEDFVEELNYLLDEQGEDRIKFKL
jgi:hypothetical protein